jgi:hypothetical protein
MPRDRASAIMTVGWALLEYRAGPDPGGRVAEKRRKQDEAAANSEMVRRARAKGGRNRRKSTMKAVGERGSAGSPAIDNTGRMAMGVQLSGAEHQESPPGQGLVFSN